MCVESPKVNAKHDDMSIEGKFSSVGLIKYWRKSQKSRCQKKSQKFQKQRETFWFDYGDFFSDAVGSNVNISPRRVTIDKQTASDFYNRDGCKVALSLTASPPITITRPNRGKTCQSRSQTISDFVSTKNFLNSSRELSGWNYYFKSCSVFTLKRFFCNRSLLVGSRPEPEHFATGESALNGSREFLFEMKMKYNDDIVLHRHEIKKK